MCVSVVQWTTVSDREAQNPISNSVHKVVRHSCTVQSPHWMERLGGDYFLPPRIVWYIWYIYVHVPPGIVWHNVPPRIVWYSVTERYRETLLIRHLRRGGTACTTRWKRDIQTELYYFFTTALEVPAGGTIACTT